MTHGGLFLLAVISSVGSALALDVTAGRGRVYESATAVALTAEYSEDGYQRVASLGSDEAMKAYIRRFLHTRGNSVRDEGFFSGFVPHYSGTAAVQSFSQLAKELRNAEWITREAAFAPEAQHGSKEYEDAFSAWWRSVMRLDETADASNNASVVVQAMPTETAKQGAQETGVQKAEGTGKAAAEALTKTVAMERNKEYEKKLVAYFRMFDWIDGPVERASNASAVVRTKEVVNMTATSDGAVADRHAFVHGLAALHAEQESAVKPDQQTSITQPDRKIAEEENEVSSEKVADDLANSAAKAVDDAKVGSALRQANDKAQAKPAPITMRNVSRMTAPKAAAARKAKGAPHDKGAARPRARPLAKRHNAATLKVQTPTGARKMSLRRPTARAAKPRNVMRRVQTPTGARKMSLRRPTARAAKPRNVMRRAQTARLAALQAKHALDRVTAERNAAHMRSMKQWEAAVDAIFSATSS